MYRKLYYLRQNLCFAGKPYMLINDLVLHIKSREDIVNALKYRILLLNIVSTLKNESISIFPPFR